MQRPLTTISALFLILIAGCTNNLTVSGDFPTPLTEPAPQTVALLIEESLRSHTYTESKENRGKWIIETGPAQLKLLHQVMPQLFIEATEITSLPSPDSPASADLVIRPLLVDFQYSVPRETRFKVFEVWMKYNFSAYDNTGHLIADWILTAYGKTPTAFMQSNEEAMNSAVITALRDLGANLTLTTRQVPEIKAWLSLRNNANTSKPTLQTASTHSINTVDEHSQ